MGMRVLTRDCKCEQKRFSVAAALVEMSIDGNALLWGLLDVKIESWMRKA